MNQCVQIRKAMQLYYYHLIKFQVSSYFELNPIYIKLKALHCDYVDVNACLNILFMNLAILVSIVLL